MTQQRPESFRKAFRDARYPAALAAMFVALAFLIMAGGMTWVLNGYRDDLANARQVAADTRQELADFQGQATCRAVLDGKVNDKTSELRRHEGDMIETMALTFQEGLVGPFSPERSSELAAMFAAQLEARDLAQGELDKAIEEQGRSDELCPATG